MTEGMERLHAAVVRAVAPEIASHDLTAREVAAYFRDAAKGMDANAAFALRGKDLADVIAPEA